MLWPTCSGTARHYPCRRQGGGNALPCVASVGHAALAYRLIEYADAARILFLVDRRNLGRQAKGEFQRFDIPGSCRKFAEVYNIQHLTGPRVDKVSRVCISTVQRMYSILRGTDIDAEIDARSLYELQAPPEPIVYNPGCLGSQPEKIYRLPQLAFCQPDEADADNGPLRQAAECRGLRSTAVTSPADARAWAEVARTKLSGGV